LLPAGVDDIRSYDPLYPQTYVEYLAEVNGISGDTVDQHYNQNMLFVVNPSRRSDPLLDLAGLSVLILPGPIEEKPMAAEWLAAAVTRSGRRESWLRSELVEAGGVQEPALTEHAPVRVSINDESLEPSGQVKAQLRFGIGVPDNQIGGDGDGVFFGVFRGRRLAFARYLDPKRCPGEWGFRHYVITWGRGTPAITMLPGPRDNQDRDAGALANPRVWEERKDENFVALDEGSRGNWLYKREQAYPRAWMAKAHYPAKGGISGPAAARIMLANNPLAMRSIFITAWDGKPAYFPTGKVVDRNWLKLARREPGRVEIEYERTDSDGYVLLSDQRLPGWRAFVSGKDGEQETNVIPADGPFIAVPAAVGKATVSLRYQPWGFRVGLWAALPGLGSAVGMIAARRKYARNFPVVTLDHA